MTGTIRHPSRYQPDGTLKFPAIRPKMDRLQAYRLACGRRGRNPWPMLPTFRRREG